MIETCSNPPVLPVDVQEHQPGYLFVIPHTVKLNVCILMKIPTVLLKNTLVSCVMASILSLKAMKHPHPKNTYEL
jgi:hypothetical protein